MYNVEFVMNEIVQMKNYNKKELHFDVDETLEIVIKQILENNKKNIVLQLKVKNTNLIHNMVICDYDKDFEINGAVKYICNSAYEKTNYNISLKNTKLKQFLLDIFPFVNYYNLDIVCYTPIDKFNMKDFINHFDSFSSFIEFYSIDKIFLHSFFPNKEFEIKENQLEYYYINKDSNTISIKLKYLDEFVFSY